MKYLLPILALTLTQPVIAQSPQDANPGEAFLQTFDADKNGSVSRDEFIKPQLQRIEQQFDSMDTNHDGSVSAEEANVFVKQLQEQLQQQMHKMQQKSGEAAGH